MPAYVATVRRPASTLTDAEHDGLLQVTGQHVAGFRDHMIYSTAVGTALREVEIAALNVGDVLRPNGSVRRRFPLRVFKRSTDQPVTQECILPDDLIYKMRKFIAWKQARGESLAPDAPLFISRLRKRISTRTIRHMLSVWQNRAGFDRRVHFHWLRHTALSKLYRRTKNIRIVQKIARHLDPKTTAIYTEPSDEEVLQAMRGQPC